MQSASLHEDAAKGAASRSLGKFRRIKMQINSIISIVAGSETAKDRRIAVKKSWSKQEKEERRKVAIDSQLRLASLIAFLDTDGSRAKDLKQLSPCG